MKQRDRYSCGPISILNAKKALGFKATYKHLKNISYWCKCKNPTGTFPNAIDKYLRSWSKVAVKRKYHPTVKDIKEGLKDGVVILRLIWRRRGISYGHFVTIVSYDGKYSICNLSTKSLEKCSYQKLDGIIRKPKEFSTIAWFIKRK